MEINFLELGISLVITIVVYLIFPLLYVSSEGKVSPKKGKKIALLNSIICSILFIVARGLISGWDTAVQGFAPAVLYYFIAKAILVDKSIEDEVVYKEKYHSQKFNNSKNVYINKMSINLKIKKLDKKANVHISTNEIANHVFNIKDIKNKLPYNKFEEIYMIYENLVQKNVSYLINKEIFNTAITKLRQQTEEYTGIKLSANGSIFSISNTDEKFSEKNACKIIRTITDYLSKSSKKLSEELNNELNSDLILEKRENVAYCKNCGYQLFPEDKKCPNCGGEEKIEKQEFEEQEEMRLDKRDKIGLIIFLVSLIVIGIVFGIFFLCISS